MWAALARYRAGLAHEVAAALLQGGAAAAEFFLRLPRGGVGAHLVGFEKLDGQKRNIRYSLVTLAGVQT